MRVLAVRPLADSAVTLDLAAEVGPEAARRVAGALAALRRAIAAGELPGATGAAGAFVSVTVDYDCLAADQAGLVARIERILAAAEPGEAAAGRHWRLPCCYDAAAGPDLDDLAAFLGIPAAEIVARHAATRFAVYALGFLPGLPFLGDLPADLARPRRKEPRLQVPAGSVAVANRMCVIYPWACPGGWHIVGACPVPLFDIARPEPALLAPGDLVRFAPVDAATCREIRQSAASGRLDPAEFLA